MGVKSEYSNSGGGYQQILKNEKQTITPESLS